MVTGTQIPNGWRVARLRELLVLDQPGVWGEEPTGDDSAVPVLRAANLTKDGRIDLSRVVLRRISDWDIKRRLMRDGDLILERSGGGPGSPVGRVALIQDHEKIYCSNFCQQLRFDAHQAYPPYMFRYLWRQYLLGVTARLEQRTTGIRNLDYSGYLLQSVILPTLPEQRTIADILDSIDEAIERTESVIAATERLRESLLHELLSHGVPGWHSAWKEVRGIGTIPADWDVVRLGDIYEVQLGKMLSPKAKQGTNPKPYLTNRNVRWSEFDLSDLPTMDFDEREMAKFHLRAGDLLVCEGGEVGRAAVWAGQMSECYYQKALHRLRPVDENCVSEFMLAILTYYASRDVLIGHSEKTSISHLTRERLLRMRIPNPTRPEQDEIVTVLRCVADLLRHARAQGEALQAFNSSAADVLLTGHVRILEGEADV